MKLAAIAALLGCSQAIVLWTVKGQIAYEAPDDLGYVQTQDWPASESGTLGPYGYEREVPERFANDDDDIFMRSMINTYAIETNSAGPDDKPVPSGHFVMDKASMKAAAAEVLCTHKQICKDNSATYMEKYFEKAWKHFDVNEQGAIDVIKTPQFMRLIASDQWMPLQ